MTKQSPIKIVPSGIPTKKVVVKVNLPAAESSDAAKDASKPSSQPDLQINSDLYITNMNAGHPSTKEIILSDRIISIDGKAPISATDAAAALKPGEKPRTVELVVERRLHAVPVSDERLAKIKHRRLEGYAYFLVNCVNKDKLKKGSLGLTLNLVNHKVYLTTAQPGSIAAQHFGFGDALLDIDGTPLPSSTATFLSNYADRFFKNGGFSVVVERPTTPARMEQTYRRMLQDDTAIKMGSDAVKIGREAAELHMKVLRKLKPTSCLTADVRNAAANTTTTTNDEPNIRKIKIATCSVSTAIGSDVEGEDELRKVERRSHSKDQMNFDDF